MTKLIKNRSSYDVHKNGFRIGHAGFHCGWYAIRYGEEKTYSFGSFNEMRKMLKAW